MSYIGNFLKTTLSADITDAATSMTVESGDGADFGTEMTRLYGSELFPYYLVIHNKDYSSPSMDTSREIVKITARSTDTFTIARGERGTSNNAHSENDVVMLAIQADDMLELGNLDKSDLISGCSVYRNSAQTFTHNVEQKIEFDTENYDALGEYDKDTNHRFTCTKPGRYAIYAQTIANESDDIVNYISIKKNGGNIAEGRIRYSTGSFFSSSAYIAVELAVNDYIEFYNLFYNYTDGGNVAIYNASSRSFATINKIA